MNCIDNKAYKRGKYFFSKDVRNEFRNKPTKERPKPTRCQYHYHLIIPYLSIILISLSKFSSGMIIFGKNPTTSWKSTQTNQNIVSRATCLRSSSFTCIDSPIHPIIESDKHMNYYNQCIQYSSIPSRFKRTMFISMGKGDGKKKKKKKTLSESTSVPKPSTPTPLRVTNDINIPIRRQIKYAQMKKEAMRTSGTSFRAQNVKRTSYRKNLDEEEIESAKILRQKRGKEPDWDVILNGTLSSPLVIIDGYNVIHKWSRLKKWMNKGMISKARQMLTLDLEELQSLKGWRIEVVFDGAGRNVQSSPLGDGPGASPVRERVTRSDMEEKYKVTDHGIRVVFSGVGMSADSYIESRCFEAKSVTEGVLTNSFIVASDDQMIRMAAKNSGAYAMSSQRIVDELKTVKKVAMYRAEVAMANVNGHVIRPETLKGARNIPSTGRFGRGQVEIVDKRKKKKEQEEKKNVEKVAELDEVIDGTKSVPSWAIIPNRTIS